MNEYIFFIVSTGVYWMWTHSPSQILVCMNHLESEVLVLMIKFKQNCLLGMDLGYFFVSLCYLK